MTTDFAFALGLITSCLQTVAVGLSWVLSAFFGRRTIYLYGTATNMALLFALGIAASLPQNKSTNYAQACLGVIISFVFALTLGPISYTIIAETSAVRFRALSTGVGRAAYYVAEIPIIYRESGLPLDMPDTDNPSRFANAQPDRVEPRWEVWVHLGRYRHCLLYRRFLWPSRAQEPIVPRD